MIVDVYKADYPMRGPLPQGFSGAPTPDEHKYLFVFVREQDPVTSVSNEYAISHIALHVQGDWKVTQNSIIPVLDI